MAKTTKATSEAAPRNRKGKTAEQIRKAQEKKAKNIAAAAERLKRLQAQQAAQLEAKARAKAHEHQAANEAAYVKDALAGTFGHILSKWLAGREATFDRVHRFFSERPKLWARQPETAAARAEAEAALTRKAA